MWVTCGRDVTSMHLLADAITLLNMNAEVKFLLQEVINNQQKFFLILDAMTHWWVTAHQKICQVADQWVTLHTKRALKKACRNEYVKLQKILQNQIKSHSAQGLELS